MSNNNSSSGLGTAGLILGILAFFFNPLYICSLLAIIFGAVGKRTSGIVLGIISLIIQIIFDIIVTIFSFGAGAMFFCC